jgi:hypothetical protein
MPIYLQQDALAAMNEARKQIFAIRTAMYKAHKIDILDTDALSALSIYEIVSQYDPSYNINFARNGEDAKSGEVLIEQKASRVNSPFTAKGKVRKNGERNAVFLFHAMGDLNHSRYIFVARDKTDLAILRLYDISSQANAEKVHNELMAQRKAWQAKVALDEKNAKRDVIGIDEKFILDNLVLPTNLEIGGCKIFKD